MDSLQDQIVILNVKLDALKQTVEQLGSQTAQGLTELKGLVGEKRHEGPSSVSGRYTSPGRSSFDLDMEHKDVLSDVNYWDSDSQTGDRSLSPEIQVQRLMAQLTAAYNRIAALEEQLLSKRVH